MSSLIRPFLELGRVGNLPTVWTNVLAAFVLTGIGFSWAGFLILAVSMSLLYSGGMSLNDVADAIHDSRNKAFRPIPSGRITILGANIFTFILFAAGVSLLLLLPFRGAIYSSLLLILFIVLYDWLHNSYPMSLFLMAACRSMVFVTAALGASGSVSLNVATGASVQFAYTLLISLLARHENNSSPQKEFYFVPLMIAGMSLVDGIVMALLVSPAWMAAGIAGAVMTHFGQRYFRGD